MAHSMIESSKSTKYARPARVKIDSLQTVEIVRPGYNEGRSRLTREAATTRHPGQPA
jgi:hypothetical protein